MFSPSPGGCGLDFGLRILSSVVIVKDSKDRSDKIRLYFSRSLYSVKNRL